MVSIHDDADMRVKGDLLARRFERVSGELSRTVGAAPAGAITREYLKGSFSSDTLTRYGPSDSAWRSL